MAKIIKKYVETFSYKPSSEWFGEKYDFYYEADLHQIYSKYSGVSVESFGSSSNEERWENAYEFSFYNSQFDEDRYFIKHKPDEYQVKYI